MEHFRGKLLSMNRKILGLNNLTTKMKKALQTLTGKEDTAEGRTTKHERG